MIRPAARGAIGCAMACGALLVGPSLVGTAVARGLVGGLGDGTVARCLAGRCQLEFKSLRVRSNA